MFAGLLLILFGQAETDSLPKDRPYWLDVAKAHIQACEVLPTNDPENAFRLHPEPIFHHVQNTRHRSVGSVFVFVNKAGRPAAVGDVFLFPRGKKHQLYNEWHSLAAVPITVKWSGGPLMVATDAGLIWKTVPKSPTPADSRLQRERQFRQLARRFTAHLLNHSDDKYELRLLTTPLYQYDMNFNATNESEYLGGGLFAFCQETDPEIFLVLEARQVDGAMKWMYAAAEFSNLRLFLQLDGQEVWSANPPRFGLNGPHVGGHLKDVDLEAPPAATPKTEP